MRQLCVDLQQLKHCALLESLTKMHKLRRQRHFYIYLLFFFVDVDQNVCVGCAHFKNSSSWVLYNMASFYWRMKNEPQKAVDCVVRALHFSPRYRRARAEATGRCNLLIESGSSQVFRRILTLCVCVCVAYQGSRRTWPWSTWPTSCTAPISPPTLLSWPTPPWTSPPICSPATTP